MEGPDDLDKLPYCNVCVEGFLQVENFFIPLRLHVSTCLAESAWERTWFAIALILGI